MWWSLLGNLLLEELCGSRPVDPLQICFSPYESWGQLVGWLESLRQEQEAPNIDSDVLLVLCRLVSLDIEVVVVGIGGGWILENGGWHCLQREHWPLKKICGLCVVGFRLEASKGYFAEKSRPASSFAISIAF